jgi:hypothetical protein
MGLLMPTLNTNVKKYEEIERYMPDVDLPSSSRNV